jgi:capsular exopolysaccharide synthesis family protein
VNDVAQESALLNRWNAGLTVNKVPRTRMIEIRFTSSDPKLAARIANSLANAYVDRTFKTRYEATLQATQFLSKQLADLQLKVETSEQALVNYQKTHNIVGLDDKQNITTVKLDDLNKDLTAAESERKAKQSVYELARREPGNMPALAGSPLFQKLQESEADLERQQAQLSTQFGPSYPKVQEIKNQLAQVKSASQAEITRAVGRAKAEYESSLNREHMLREALNRQKTEATELSQHSIEYLQLKREAESNRALYESLNQKVKEASVTSNLKLSNITMVDPARVPSSPSSPNARGNLTFGLLFGMMGGLGVALLLEALDNTVRTTEQVEEITSLPALGMVPLSLSAKPERASGGTALTTLSIQQPKQPAGLVALTRPRSQMAEAYRALRTSILLSAAGRTPQTILLTSALPQEGKTTTSVNTAIVLAQKGSRVLLIDADMRRPSVHKVFGLRTRHGLSSVLSGAQKLEDCVAPAPGVPNLDVLSAGTQPPNPAELLGSNSMRDLLEQWKEQYDFIVVDTPPVLSVTDAVLLSAWMDAIILVIRSGKTTKDALRRVRDLFRKVNLRLLGVVVNAVDMQSAEARYYGYYGYGNEKDPYYAEEPEMATVSQQD